MSSVRGDVWISRTDLRRDFHRVLREVERGLTLTITRRGRPVARLVSAAADRLNEPNVPLFRSDIEGFASRTDEFMEGFGEL